MPYACRLYMAVESHVQRRVQPRSRRSGNSQRRCRFGIRFAKRLQANHKLCSARRAFLEVVCGRAMSPPIAPFVCDRESDVSRFHHEKISWSRQSLWSVVMRGRFHFRRIVFLPRDPLRVFSRHQGLHSFHEGFECLVVRHSVVGTRTRNVRVFFVS